MEGSGNASGKGALRARRDADGRDVDTGPCGGTNAAGGNSNNDDRQRFCNARGGGGGARSDTENGGDPPTRRLPPLSCEPARTLCGCIVAMLGHHDGTLAAAVIHRLGLCDLFALWRTSLATQYVLADVLARADGPFCSSGMVRATGDRLADAQHHRAEVWVSPRNVPFQVRVGAAWLVVRVVPRLQSKYALVQHALGRHATTTAKISLPSAAYERDAVEQTLIWASATRCGAAINACLDLSESLSAASTAYSACLGRTRKRPDDTARVDAWLADVMGVVEGAAVGLATTDVWASAIGLATAAGRLRSDLLLTLACRIASTNLATGRGFSHLGRRLAEPTSNGERAYLASCRLVAAVVRGLSQARCASDPPCRIDIDAHGDGGDAHDGDGGDAHDGDDERTSRLLRRIASDGLMDGAVRAGCGDRPDASAASDLDEACNRLCAMATQQPAAMPRTTEAARMAIARVLVLASPIDCPGGLRAHSLTARVWASVALDLAKARAESFWSALNSAKPEPLPTDNVRRATKTRAVLRHRRACGINVGRAPRAPNSRGAITVANAEGDDRSVSHFGHDRRDAMVDGIDADSATLLGLLEHRVGVCAEIVAFLNPWDAVSLFTASRTALGAVWRVACRATLGAETRNLTSVACGGSIDVARDGTPVMALVAPAPDADFARVLGALMLVCHRMPRMEMIAEDVEILAYRGDIADSERDAIVTALERDPNLPAMLADTVTRAARLGCGAVISRCLCVARRMRAIARQRMRVASDARLDAWLLRQTATARPSHVGDILDGDWLPAAALAYAAGREKSVALLSLACAQVGATSRVAPVFWGPAGRRVDVRAWVGGSDIDANAEQTALVVLACIVGTTRGAIRTETRTPDDAFFSAVEALVGCLSSQDRGNATARLGAAEPGSPAWHVSRLRAPITEPSASRVASVCLGARFLIAPPGRPLSKDSARDRVARLLLDVAACGAQTSRAPT
ncbi:hypothetical protein pneo_cds_925 [Pandoravirus neocaledonia]|uniref:DUF5867 domain-containing protein n=1 Tax=Pandoravirus neocaledonia TaxID=2107708 RepID=A0A2U7UDP1_9VIRU|nr:hypothetical protein pneo_cds_925 [Pandoravirus neocaledonia]AVK76532.1 hypothetical protein pneo_cds_925 [Pandoravirus neocaledonia]